MDTGWKVRTRPVKRKAAIDYKQSNIDIVALTKYVKTAYPNIPLYVIGESLGADMALHIASECPNLVDGLILAAPSVKHRWFVADLVKKRTNWLEYAFQADQSIAPHPEVFLG